MLATAATYVGPAEDAEYAYRWLIKIDPDNAAHYASLSQLRAEDDLEEAVKLLDKAQSINPNITNKNEAEFSRKALSNGSRRAPVARAKYPTSNEMRGDLTSTIRNTLLRDIAKESFIAKNTRFFTLGSCFAREIAIRLAERGYQADFFEVVEHINSSFANRSMVDWAFDRCTGQAKTRLDELFASLNITPQGLKARWAVADVFIYTLGVAPAFFDRQSGEFVMPTNSALGSRAFAELFDFRTTTVQENLENLEYIISHIKSLNPQVRIVITVSPVPLKTTFEFKSAMQADCVSKSTLRVVAHEFVSKHPEIIYWPSFEVVRWIGGHVGPFYGNDDDAALHVGDHVVKAITDLFIEHFS
jgi:tetratricopeptide (TPR) repeat protein